MKRTLLSIYSLRWIGLLAVLTGCGGKWDPTDPADISREFTVAFALSPPGGVKFIECSVVNVGDTSSRWFCFDVSRPSFEGLIANGFESIESAKLFGAELKPPLDLMNIRERNVNTPKWWPNLKDVQFERLYYRSQRTDASNGYLFLVLDRITGRAYASSSTWR